MGDIRIVSDKRDGAHVFVDGEEVEGIVEVRWACVGHEPALANIVALQPTVDILLDAGCVAVADVEDWHSSMPYPASDEQ